MSTTYATSIIIALSSLALLTIAGFTLLLRDQQARHAADLAAIAAATAYHTTGKDPCDTARRITERNHARLTRCTLNDVRPGSVQVGVVVPYTAGLRSHSAAAGPVEAN